MAVPGRLRLSGLAFRPAAPSDAAPLAALFARSFSETFGDLYRPADLAAFLAGHDEARWARELADPAFAIRVGEAAEAPPIDGEWLGWGGASPNVAPVADLTPSRPFPTKGAGAKPVAYLKLGPPTLPFEPRGRPVELRQFYILKPWQGTGAAAELMEWALDTAARRGFDELYLSVFIDNHRARRFYERYGFEQVGAYAFMVGDHADEDIVLRKGL